MSIFQRIANLIRANINDLIDRAEDPDKILTQAIEDMRKQMVEAKSRVAMAIADEKRLQKQHEMEAKRSEEWEKKAMAAIRATRDDLALEALEKKKQHESMALQFQRQHEEQKAAVEELKKALTALNAKIDEARHKKQLLVARHKRAEAQKAIAQTLSLAKDRSALDGFERMSQKIDRIEAEAEAQLEIAELTSGSEEQKLEEKIRLLEAAPVNDDLVELKKKMGLLGSGTPQKALEAGSPIREAPPPEPQEPPKSLPSEVEVPS
ncbi:MAG: PspA/IM30 family protein [Deltaproteobacteria bacterium]|nr:PspA/IM30 family protein [Deltaproteobacteria bacterium]